MITLSAFQVTFLAGLVAFGMFIMFWLGYFHAKDSASVARPARVLRFRRVK